MRHFSILITLAFPLSLFSQTITDADILHIGLQVQVHMSAYQASDSGANMTWDYSNLTIDSSYVMDIVLPSTTPQGANFPLATAAEVRTGDHPGPHYTYYEVNSDGCNILGSASDTAFYSLPTYRTILEFPCVYGSEWDYSSSSGFSGISRTGIADGFGTLEMPYGTVNNVLRVVERHGSWSWISSGSTTTTSFYKPGVGWPVLVTTVYSSSAYLPPGYIAHRLFWIDLNDITGLEESDIQDIGIDLYPNPSNSSTQVVFGAQGEITIELIDVSGRPVLAENLGKLPPGIHKHGLDVSGLPAGVYTVLVQNENNERGVKRLVVE